MPRTFVYRGKKLDLTIETALLPDGRTVEKEIILHRGAAVMIPILDTSRIVLVQNYRYSIGQTLLELPAGTLEPDEPPERTALRELEEETGYRAGRCRKLAEFYPSPGILSELMHLYVMEDLAPGRQQLEAGEQVQPVIVPWSEAVRMALDGSIKDGKTILGLLLWERKGREA